MAMRGRFLPVPNTLPGASPTAGVVAVRAVGGEQADRRMRAVADSRGYQLDSISRRIDHQDFGQFDLIVTMDDSNYRHINTLHPGIGAEVVRMCDYSEKYDITEVPDPYYGGEAGFHKVLDILEDACSNQLRSL